MGWRLRRAAVIGVVNVFAIAHVVGVGIVFVGSATTRAPLFIGSSIRRRCCASAAEARHSRHMSRISPTRPLAAVGPTRSTGPRRTTDSPLGARSQTLNGGLPQTAKTSNLTASHGAPPHFSSGTATTLSDEARATPASARSCCSATPRPTLVAAATYIPPRKARTNRARTLIDAPSSRAA
jgi:hypothetical protein